jgi:FMN-dependent NADH-azoreductase
MNNILLVTSSPRGEASYSTKVARSLVDRLKAEHPGATVTLRDLAAEPPPHIGEDFAAGISTPLDKRSAAQGKTLAYSDTLVEELEAADVVVVASAMINFSVTSTLKAWIDYVTRSGRTFRYTDAGVPEGLLKGKKAYIVESRGGIYSKEPLKAIDFQEPYLKHVLGFIGLTDVTVVAVEGVAYGPDAAKTAVSSAMEQIPVFAAMAA